MARLDDIRARIADVDEVVRDAAAARQRELTKPPGSLGRLEDLGNRLAAIAGTCPPPVVTRPVVALFAADHGVCAQGVTPWPQEITVQMAANIAAGGAAISVLARQFGADVLVTDVGIATSATLDGVVDRCVRRGTADLSVEPAMTPQEAEQSILVGYETASKAIDAGADCVVTGEMGIGNTTASAAVIAALSGHGASEVVGRGAGADDAMLAHKTAVVQRALDLHAEHLGDPLGVLQHVGGLELGAIAGAVLAAAEHRVPVIIDGVIASASALIAVGIAPAARGYLVGGHAGVEPGIAAAHRQLGLDPLVDLDLRLGEGSGAILAVPLVQAAARILGEMSTFAEAGVG